MKSTIFRAHRAGLSAALAVIALAAPAFAQDAGTTPVMDLPQLAEPAPPDDSFELEAPIPVVNANGQNQLLMGMDGGQLMLSFPNLPEAVAIVPLNDRGLNLNRQFPADYNRLVVAADGGDVRPLYRQLGPVAEPLLRFLVIPERKCNFHGMALQYYRAAVVAAPLGKLLELTAQMPWSTLSQEFVDELERAVARSIAEGDVETTEKLLAIALASFSDRRFAELAFPTADRLRALGYHRLASKIYGSMARSTDPALSQRSLLWAGYGSAVSGNPGDARAIFEQVAEPDPDDDNFIIYCLARGRLGLSEDNHVDGLRYLTRAMVMTDYSETFKPELYYLLIEAYRALGEDDVVDRLAREFEIFYPENPWFAKFREEAPSGG